MRAGGGNGFGIKSKASDIAWAEQYKAYIRRSGEGICRMAMDGFKKVCLLRTSCPWRRSAFCLGFTDLDIFPEGQELIRWVQC
jgi:hypothetical protein